MKNASTAIRPENIKSSFEVRSRLRWRILPAFCLTALLYSLGFTSAAQSADQPSAAAQKPDSAAILAAVPEADKPAFAALLDKLVALKTDQAKRMAPLESALGEFDLATQIQPENLVNADRIAQSKKNVNRYWELMQQELVLLDQFAKEGEQLIRESAIKPDQKTRALEGLRESYAPYRKSVTVQAPVHKKIVDAMLNILNMAEQNLGKINIRDGMLKFRTQQALDIYNTNFDIAVKAQQESERLAQGGK